MARGKFEGCPAWVPLAFEAWNAGFADDELYKIRGEDRIYAVFFSEQGKEFGCTCNFYALVVWEDDQGFACYKEFATAEEFLPWRKTVED